MSWKIVTDSAADVSPDFVPEGDILFEEVPLTLTIGEKDYVDNDDLDTMELMKAMQAESKATTSSCPSPNMYKKAFEEADNVIAVTLSHNLSGSYNAAELAKKLVLEEHPEKNIYVVDSHATAGVEVLIAEKAAQLINEGKEFDEICKELEDYADSLDTIYTLCNYGNLIKNGRMSKIAGLLAKGLKIRIIGDEQDGKINLLHKIRGEAKSIAKLVDVMGQKKDMTGLDVVIHESNNLAGATAMKHLIEKKYPEVNSVRITSCGGLNSYYAEDGGLIVGY